MVGWDTNLQAAFSWQWWEGTKGNKAPHYHCLMAAAIKRRKPAWDTKGSKVFSLLCPHSPCHQSRLPSLSGGRRVDKWTWSYRREEQQYRLLLPATTKCRSYAAEIWSRWSPQGEKRFPTPALSSAYDWSTLCSTNWVEDEMLHVTRSSKARVAKWSLN